MLDQFRFALKLKICGWKKTEGWSWRPHLFRCFLPQFWLCSSAAFKGRRMETKNSWTHSSAFSYRYLIIPVTMSLCYITDAVTQRVNKPPADANTFVMLHCPSSQRLVLPFSWYPTVARLQLGTQKSCPGTWSRWSVLLQWLQSVFQGNCAFPFCTPVLYTRAV